MSGKSGGEGDATDIAALDVQKALIAAEAQCTARGTRMNDASRGVLKALLQADRPQKAYDLTHALATSGRSAAPPTVYRALKFLVEAGLAHRIESLNAHVACCFPGEPHLAGFHICERCGAVEEFRLEATPPEIGGPGPARLVFEVLRPCTAFIESNAQAACARAKCDRL